MISIKRFLDPHHEELSQLLGVVDALVHMGRLLLDGMALYVVRGRQADCDVLRKTLSELANRIDEPHDILGFLGIASEAS